MVIGKQWVSATAPLHHFDTIYVSSNPNTVFYYHKLLQEKVPLLIFNVQAGDTIWYPTPDYMMTYSDFYWKSVVDSVVYFNVNGRALRRVYTHEPYGGCCTFAGKSYSERIGSFDYFTHLRYARIPEDSRTLRCYLDSQIAYHVDTAIPCDDHPPVQAVSSGIVPADWQVAPNPVSGKLTVKGTTERSFTYRLYTLQGSLQASGSAVSTDGIDVAEVPSGWYLLQIQVADAVYSQRVLIR